MEGKLTISEIRSTTEDGYVQLKIVDSISGKEFIRIDVSHKNFSQALMGNARVPVTYETNFLDSLGKKRIKKSVQVTIPYTNDRSKRKEWAIKEMELLCEGGFEPFLPITQDTFEYPDNDSYKIIVNGFLVKYE